LSERIEEMPLAALRARGGVADLVQLLSRMLMGWVADSMTTLSLRLNGLDGAEVESQGGESGPENEKREVNQPVPWLGNMEPATEACETTDKGKNKRLGSCR
jgi:hypothetical protein